MWWTGPPLFHRLVKLSGLNAIMTLFSSNQCRKILLISPFMFVFLVFFLILKSFIIIIDIVQRPLLIGVLTKMKRLLNVIHIWRWLENELSSNLYLKITNIVSLRAGTNRFIFWYGIVTNILNFVLLADKTTDLVTKINLFKLCYKLSFLF